MWIIKIYLGSFCLKNKHPPITLMWCESEWTPGVGDGHGGLVCCNSWGHKESDTTEWLNWTERPQVGKSVVGPRTFLTVREFLWYNCSAVCGSSARCLYGGANGDLLQEGLSHTLHDPDLVQPEPLSPQQVTADPRLHRRHSNTQRQVWLTLCGVSGSWCTQGFVWALWASLVGMGFDSKCDFAPPTILLGILLCPWMWGIFFGGIQHSPVDGCSAVSCNFGVLSGEDEHTSFYSTILLGQEHWIQ